MQDVQPDDERDDPVDPAAFARPQEPVTATVPVGWPQAVLPPGHPRFDDSARAWLYDQAPGEWRAYEVLHRHPLMLARNLRYLVGAELEGLRAAYARARVELAEHFEPIVIEQQLKAYAVEAERVKGLMRQAQLVEDALSGVRWVPRL